ncbi:hypothetical protein [Methyloversatilis sp.]|uniref:hypothetical protein n=1 Tax=Methyloversatilis sp. TaxID=2569862 RepID=UPI0035ADD801
MRNWLIAAAIAVAFSMGFYTSSQFEKADKVEEVKEEIKEIENAVVDSQRRDSELDARIDEGKDRSEAAKIVVRKIPVVVREVVACEEGLGAQTVDHAGQADTPSVDSPVYLTRGAVSVLDTARQNIDLDSSAVVDEESRKASDVTVEELIQNDLEVTRMYHELAERHDSLVDFVQSKIPQK